MTIMLSNNQKRLPKFFGTEAFTLIELTVVLAIIGILAAISISIIYAAKKGAYDAIAKHDLQNFAKSEDKLFWQCSIKLGTKSTPK